MNLDPRTLMGEEAAVACTSHTRAGGSAQENAAAQLGVWIDELTGQDLRFGADCLTDRIGIMGLSTVESRVSFGGATRLIRCADGWVALPLARAADIEMLPALFEREIGETVLRDPDRRWAEVESLMAESFVNILRDRSAMLGMPLSVMGEVLAPSVALPALQVESFGSIEPKRVESLRVLELAPMWAGPLAGKVLAIAGANVAKVESPKRPDGTREGSPTFFEYLNSKKVIKSLDFSDQRAGEELRAMIRGSDVVIEGSRPRALEQIGIDARQMLRDGEVDIWLSVTGYGRDSNRVAFGDDAAVAGGLCDTTAPAFTGDASGDPLTGLAGAVGILAALSVQHRALIDLSMSRVCAWAAAG